eukprot:gene33043-42753_t
MAKYITQLFIDGVYVDPVRGGTFPNYNPSNGELIATVANGTSEDIDLAVAAASRCLNSEHWGFASTGKQRAAILRKLKDVITDRKDEIALLDSLDMGKPVREALADLGDAISACDHFANLAEEQDAKQHEVIENGTGGDFTTTILLEPVGIVGAITPWNYPFLMGIWKVIPAIAAGCCIVLKPSELAPLSCLLFGELCNAAGLPQGALNVVSGLGADAGGPLSNHPDIDKLSFTGSLPTARKIMAAAALGPRALSLELGGKSPLIVFEDADVPSAVDWIILGVLWGSGQVCSSTSRVLVHSSLRETLLQQLKQRVDAVLVGDALNEQMMNHQGPTMGPIVSKGQYDRVSSFIAQAKEENLTFLCGGEPSADFRARLVGGPAVQESGFFIPPTVLVDVPVTSRLWKEEIFGPVLCIREFLSEEEAVAVANATEYGLAGAVFSADEARCERVTRKLRVGIMWKNCCQPAFIQAPWGGVKASGFGRELGRWGLEEFTTVKQVTGCKSGFSWGLY